MAQMLGVDTRGIASHLVIAAVLDKPLQRILPLRPVRLGAGGHRAGADRVLQRALDDCAPQLALGKSAAVHEDSLLGAFA